MLSYNGVNASCLFTSSSCQLMAVSFNSSPVTSGLPQGSVQGSLFLTHINDLPNNISSSKELFADDCIIYREMLTTTDSVILQADLNSVSAWCDTWLIKLNETKGKVMRISQHVSSFPPCNYSLSNALLSQVSLYKYLGIHITENFSWQVHMDHIINSANRSLGHWKMAIMCCETLIEMKRPWFMV